MTPLPDEQQPGASAGQVQAAGLRIPLWLMRLPHGVRQFLKFALVGGSGTGVNFAVFSLILFVWVTAHAERPLIVEQVASGVAFCLAVTSNFLLNRRWTFRHHGPLIPHFGRFFLVSLLGLGLNVLSYTALHSWLDLQEHLSQLLAIGIVMPFNFAGSKLWAFR